MKNERKIAKLTPRVLGGLIDLIIILALATILIFVWGLIVGASGNERHLSAEQAEVLWNGRGILVGLLVDFLYTVGMQNSAAKATLGQRLMGLQIVSDTYKDAVLGKLILRYVVSLFSSLILKIGFIVALFTNKKQTLHDLLASTIVVIKMDESSKIIKDNEPDFDLNNPFLKNSDGSNRDVFQKSSSASGNDKESKNNIKSEFVLYENSSNKAEIISSLNTKTSSDVDDVFYEKALEEYEEGRRKGLWIKILSTNEGNETKSKFEYIRVRAKEIQIEYAELEKQQSILNESLRQEQINKQLLLEGRIGKHKQITIKGEDCLLLEDGKVLYKMKNGDYLIYKNETTMTYYLEFRQKSVGFIGVLKKDNAINIPKQEDNVETVISVCRKCSLRLRVKNSTGMIKCPECGHGWLFEKMDIENPPNMNGYSASKPSNKKINDENFIISEIKLFLGSFNTIGYVAMALMVALIAYSLTFP
jgi:uncharacterized RDD family membrane protein YckC